MSTHYEGVHTDNLRLSIMTEDELDADGYEGDEQILVLSYDEVVTIHGDLPKFGRMVADAVGVKHAGQEAVRMNIARLEYAIQQRVEQMESEDDVPMDDLLDADYALQDAATALIESLW